MKQVQKISLDMSLKRKPESVVVKQGDIDARFVDCHLIQDDQEWTPGENVYATYAFLKPDGKQVYQDAQLHGNVVSVSFSEQCLTEVGTGQCEVILMEGKSILSLATFPVYILPNVYHRDGIESTDEYGAMVKATAEAKGILKELETFDTDEASRVSAESVRVQQEQQRQAQENIRVSAEQTRAEQFANMESICGIAQTNGDYAKTQGDYAKQQADRLSNTDVSGLQTGITSLQQSVTALQNDTQTLQSGLQSTNAAVSSAADSIDEITAEKGAAGGLASLDANGHVLQDPASAGQNGGVATLSSTGKLVQMPIASDLGIADYLVENNTVSGWTYRKWNSGMIEMWTYVENTSATTSVVTKDYIIPIALTKMIYAAVQPLYNAWNVTKYYMNQQRNVSELQNAKLAYYTNTATSMVYGFTIQIIGRWK